VSELRVKFPRIPHLPWSPGRTSDDLALEAIDRFVGREVVVTEKVDGECSALYRDGLHARSIDSKAHPSRSWLKAFHAQIKHNLHYGFQYCGENLYAKHSIEYKALSSYFLLFGVHQLEMHAPGVLSWDSTLSEVQRIGVDVVPTLYRGPWNERAVMACYTGQSRFGGDQEGYVVRLADEFPLPEFATSVAKFVRADHVQTDDHWSLKKVVPNRLAKEAL